MGKRSCSRIWVTSLPSTVMRPESGSSRPNASLRIVLLPDPATPNRALVSPRGRWNETPRKTALSSKERCTSSKTMAEADGRSTRASKAAGMVGVDIQLPAHLMERQHRDQQLGDKEIGDQNKYGGGHYRLRRRATDSLGTTTRGDSVIAPHRRDDEAEHNRLEQSHEHILQHEYLPGVAPVLTSVKAEKKLRNHEPPGESDEIGNDAQEEQHEDSRRHARRDQFLDRVGAKGAHGIDLLGHDHRAEFAGHAGRVPSGNHESSEHRAQFAHHGCGNQLPDQGD